MHTLPAKSWSLHTLPRKITESSYLALQNYGAMQTLPRKMMEEHKISPAKSRSLHTLPRKITEPSYFAPRNYGAKQTCPAKSWRHSFRGQNNNLKLDFLFFFLTFFVNYYDFRDICNHSDHFLRKKYFASRYL